MIFITAKFRVLPEHADRWPQIAEEFTTATRAEPGCLWFDWSRSLADPTEYVLVEAFRDDEAAAAHVQSDDFKVAHRDLPPHLAETPHPPARPAPYRDAPPHLPPHLAEPPRIVNFSIPQDDWSQLGELAVD